MRSAPRLQWPSTLLDVSVHIVFVVRRRNVITVRCTERVLPEAELAASPIEYADLAATIESFATSDTEVISITTARCDAPPYERCLAVMRFAKLPGALKVSLGSDFLSISGDRELLSLFARNLPTESDLPNGYHVQFDSAGREDMVSHESVPLVLLVTRDTVA